MIQTEEDNMFYKTSDEATIKGWNEYWENFEMLKKQANTLGEMFGGTPVINQDFTGVTFHSLKFKTEPNRSIWAFHRDSKSWTPRSKATHKEHRIDHTELKQRWDDCVSVFVKVDKSSYLIPLGLCWSDVAFQGLGAFFYNGYLYIETNITELASHCTEIFGSEFNQALKLFEAEKKV